MPMNISLNARMLETRLEQLGDRAMKGMSEQMRRHAIKIRDLARAYAPVKTGLLEKSIDYAVLRENRRNVYVVYIDTEAARFSGDGSLGDYAMIMHQQLHPYGRQAPGGRRFNLGVKSAAKAASGKKVGGRFLTRATSDANVDLMSKLVGEVRRVTNSQSSLGLSAPNRYPSGDQE